MIDILMMTTMLLPVLIVVVFSYVARKQPVYRRFVIPLAAGWAVGVMASIVWGVHDMLSSSPLPPLSWVDSFFIFRDILYLFAFLRVVPTPLSRRQIAVVCCAVVIALGAMLVSYIGLNVGGRDVSLNYWGGAIYPVLDIMVLGVALMRYPVIEDPKLRRTAWWVIVALLFYFAANVAQFLSLTGGQTSSGVALLLWPLSDLAGLVGAISLAWTKSDKPG